jgi:hypothetical protein
MASLKEKKAIAHWFGERGIPLSPKYIKKYSVKGIYLHVVIKLPKEIEGIYFNSTEKGYVDVYNLTSSCAELWDTLPCD